MKLNGKLSISRIQSSAEADYVEIRIEDDDASTVAIEVKVSIQAFAIALMGSGYQNCVFDFNDSGNVGTKHENKEELIPIPSYGSRDYKDKSWQKHALAPFEIDGWRARSGDIDNHHRHKRDAKGNEFQSVVFFRNVPKTKEVSK